METEQQRKLTVEKLVFRGDGLGHYGDKAVFIPMVAPGEIVTWKPLREKTRYIRGRLLEVTTSSPDRVLPTCPAFGQCGGCQWQHLRYAAQLYWKREIVSEILTRVRGVSEGKIREIIPSPQGFHYRSRTRLALGRNGPGYYRAESHRIVSVRQCPLLDERLNRVLTELSEVIKGSFWGRKRGELLIENGDLGRPRVILRFSAPFPGGGERNWEELDEIIGLAKDVSFSLWWDISSGDEPELLAGNDSVVLLPVEGMKIKLTVPPGGFFQANLGQNRRLSGLVIQALEEEGLLASGVRVLDFYCGMGNFSIPLAFRGCEVTGVDSASSSIEAARRNAAANGVSHVEFVRAEAARYFRESLSKGKGVPDALILDPPRIGAKELVKAMVGSGILPGIIVYVSCDPMTLARDLKYLLEDALYEVRSVTPFDMFPQTFHIETVTVLRRK